jgi:hypothetical protein
MHNSMALRPAFAARERPETKRSIPGDARGLDLSVSATARGLEVDVVPGAGES